MFEVVRFKVRLLRRFSDVALYQSFKLVERSVEQIIGPIKSAILFVYLSTQLSVCVREMPVPSAASAAYG